MSRAVSRAISSHRGVHRHAVVYRRGTAPVAEVGDDQAESGQRPAQQRGGPLADETVTRPVEPVAPHPVPGVPLLGHRVPEGAGRQGLVERGVEHRHLRQVGPDGADRLDSGQVGRVVQRRQVADRADRRDHLVVHQHRAGEPLATVYVELADADQATLVVSGQTRPGLGQAAEDPGNDRPVTAVGESLGDDAAGGAPDPQHRLGRADPLGQPVRHALAAAGMHEGEFHRRAARVQHQDQAGIARLAGALPRSGHLSDAPRDGPNLNRPSACQPTGMP